MMESGDTPVLTVNPRLARYLLSRHSERMRGEGRVIWETPQIFDLSSWLQNLWNDSWPDRFILSDIQRRKIWEGIITRFLPPNPSREPGGIRKQSTLLHRRAAARSAAQAYALVREYKLKIDPGSLFLTRESEFFCAGLKQYEKQLRQYGAIDPADLPDAVREGMKQHQIPLPKEIRLCGFEEITPQLETLVDFLKTQRVPVTLDPDPRDAPSPTTDLLRRDRNLRILPFTDGKEEAVQCARWIRSVFTEGKRIGVVIPELARYRQKIQNELGAELAPQSVYPWNPKEPPFDISLGSPLADEPMVQTVLHLLSIQSVSVPLAVFLHIIRSPYLNCGRKNIEAVNSLEVCLQEKNHTTVHLDRIESLYDKTQAPELHQLIHEWKKLPSDPAPCLPSVRAKTISDLMESLGWPQPATEGRPLTSREIQCLKKWNESLDQLASLDPILGKLSLEDTARELYQIAQSMQFQVKTKEEPILVTDLEQSSGMAFDHLWVMGCHADCFPAPPDPNPFLPLSLQKKLGLPHADPKRELQFAEQALRRLIASSKDIVFSYPLWDKETELMPSPLFAPFINREQGGLPLESHRIKDHMQSGTPMETWEDPKHLLPSILETERFSVHGLRAGYRVLKDQADCPFRAFAAHRLGAEPLDIADVDFDHRERGNLIHKALELFWKKHRTRRNLLQLKNEHGLADALAQSVREAMRETGDRLTRQPRFSELEEERSRQLLADWMEQELLRSDFLVSHEEKKETATLGGLKLNLRIDRIDTAPDGSTLLVDYKTGQVKPRLWFTDRIQEPQLPLYASQLKPQGIAFAQIAKGEFQWHSVTDQNSPLKAIGKIPRNISPETGWPDWKKLMVFWKTRLSRLANEFMEGNLVVDPIRKEDTCRTCGLQSLCRIGEDGPEESPGEIQ